LCDALTRGYRYKASENLIIIQTAYERQIRSQRRSD
jgi:hypothetical protein